MKAFAQLYGRLDATTSSNAKLAALQDYFSQAQPADAAWAVYFLAGGRPRQLVPSRVLREIGMQQAALPEWLFEESYQAVGDLAETLSLLLPESLHSSEAGLADWIEHHLLPLRGASPEDLAQRLPALWAQLDQQSLMVCIKLITGSFRVGRLQTAGDPRPRGPGRGRQQARGPAAGGLYRVVAQAFCGRLPETDRRTVSR